MDDCSLLPPHPLTPSACGLDVVQLVKPAQWLRSRRDTAGARPQPPPHHLQPHPRSPTPHTTLTMGGWSRAGFGGLERSSCQATRIQAKVSQAFNLHKSIETASGLISIEQMGKLGAGLPAGERGKTLATCSPTPTPHFSSHGDVVWLELWESTPGTGANHLSHGLTAGGKLEQTKGRRASYSLNESFHVTSKV
ncbi:unnamed protein product [Pleuronectes platessa]|uniref:Uncharacterized protein n=1 Tax=Pleuronectes platessa TaxID=8262 RepID=A0A9N7UX27_PLEPL|nr:unnamed protein product [Pleuronectes platessa]